MIKIFLSHAAFDFDLAIYLKTILEEHLRGIEVFCSTDPTDLPLGTKWPIEIQRALDTSDIFLLLATSRSLSRPWVWFECGTFWFKDKKLIPLCIGQIQKNKLPIPLSERIALNLEDPSDIENLFRAIEDSTSITREPLDISAIVKSLKEKEKIAGERILIESGWIGIPWNEKFLSYDGPIEGLELIEDRVFQQSMADVLKYEGFDVRLSNLETLSHYAEKGYRIIYLTDRKSWRQKITQSRLILIAKPN